MGHKRHRKRGTSVMRNGQAKQHELEQLTTSNLKACSGCMLQNLFKCSFKVEISRLMVRNYKRKSNRGAWTDGQIQLAIEQVKNGKSIKSCAEEFGIPRTTLHKKLSNPSSENGFKKVFNDEQEKALYDFVIDMENRLLGLTAKELRKLAYDFAVKLNISHRFNEQSGLAGSDWLAGFMKRFELSNRKPEPTSAARANGFNKDEVDRFFNLLKSYQDQYNFSAARVWNVDETGVSIVPKGLSRIIARKGRKQVGGKTSAERGETVTAEICMSASGVFMPPMLIFPRVKVNDKYLEGKLDGSWAEWHKSGWMQTDLFTKWFKKFIKFSNASVEDPVLLLLDGHHTHVKNLEVAQLGKENGVIILCFPPHCTHRMQPLDVSFMKPLSNCYAEEVKSFQRTGHQVQMKDIFSLFGTAWQKAAKVDTAVKSFKTTGIFPLNIHIFDFHFESLNNSFSSSNSSNNKGDSVNIAQYNEVISNIVSDKAKDVSIPVLHAASAKTAMFIDNTSQCFANSKIVDDTSPDGSQNSVEPEVKIHLSYILQAEPLISLLHKHVALATSVQNCDATNTATQDIENLQSQSNMPADTTNKSVCSRKRNRGTATIVTSDSHIEKLVEAEEAKRIKIRAQRKL